MAVGLCASAACSSGRPGGGSSGGRLTVVAAESFWGSIASQLGGSRADVRSVITDPNADPHDYESTSADARLVASANYVVINGAGYDAWADKLVNANHAAGRTVTRIGDLVGARTGDNPHLWYNPAFVEKAADQMTADLQRLDPAHRDYFAQQRVALRRAMQSYRDLVSSIRTAYAGTKIGATETIFEYMAQGLNLDLVSPQAFMEAVAEGNDPPAASVADFQRQVSDRTIKVLVFNSQTATAVTTNIERQASRNGIRTIAVTETMPRRFATFQAWQEAQLRALQAALAGAAA